MTATRTCQDCGTPNLADADYCAACGVAIETAGVERPWLAALVDDETVPTPTDDTVRRDPDATAPSPEPTVAPAPAPVATTARPPTASSGETTTVGAAIPPFGDDATQPMGGSPPVAYPAASSGRSWFAPTIAVFVVIALAATLLALFIGTRSDSEQPTTSAGTSDPTIVTSAAPTSEPGPTDTTAPETTVASTTPSTTVDPTAAAAELAALADADRARVLSLQGRWVPQLSAKTDGTEWEGVVYDLPTILDLHQQLTAQVGDTLLVEGSTLAFLIDGERMAGWWITLADLDFDDADGALAWCADAGFDRSNCAARLLTDDDTATGTLRLQST